MKNTVQEMQVKRINLSCCIVLRATSYCGAPAMCLFGDGAEAVPFAMSMNLRVCLRSFSADRERTP